MTAIELMDSRKFMNLLEEFWKQCSYTTVGNQFRTACDENTEKVALALQAVLDMAVGRPMKATAPMPVKLVDSGLRARNPMMDADVVITDITEARPKRKRRTKAEMEADAKDELTPDQIKRYAAEADRAAMALVPPEVLIKDFANNVMKPAYAKGVRQFAIPNTYKGRVISTSDERWKLVLANEGFQFSELDWSYPVVDISVPIPDDHIPLALK